MTRRCDRCATVLGKGSCAWCAHFYQPPPYEIPDVELEELEGTGIYEVRGDALYDPAGHVVLRTSSRVALTYLERELNEVWERPSLARAVRRGEVVPLPYPPPTEVTPWALDQVVETEAFAQVYRVGGIALGNLHVPDVLDPDGRVWRRESCLDLYRSKKLQRSGGWVDVTREYVPGAPIP